MSKYRAKKYSIKRDYKKESLRLLKSAFQQYANVSIVEKDEAVRKIYTVAYQQNLLDHPFFCKWYKEYEVKQQQFERGKRDGTWNNNWNFINDIVMAYKAKPSLRRLAFLKKVFVIFLGRFFYEKISYVGNNLQKKRLGKYQGMPYPFDLRDFSLDDILLEWIFEKTNTKKYIYGKDLLNRYDSSKGAKFSTYFYKAFTRDLRNIAKWSMVKKYNLTRRYWKFRNGYIVLEKRTGEKFFLR